MAAVAWSNSADWVLRRCRRKFWFQYIHASPRAKWGSTRREISILANIQTLEQWRGNLVHSVIKDFVVPALKVGKSLSRNELLEFTASRAQRQLAFSLTKKYRQTGMTKTQAGDSYAALWQDEFGPGSTTLTPDEAINEATTALTNLLRLTTLLNELTDSLWMEAETSIHLKEATIPITGRIDVIAARRSIQILQLLDWKLDRAQRHDYAVQLWLYAYLVERAERYQDSNFVSHPITDHIKRLPKKLVEVNLLSSEIVEHIWTDEQKRLVEERIFSGTRRIETILDGREPNEIDGTELSVTENPNNCSYCPFRAPCQLL